MFAGRPAHPRQVSRPALDRAELVDLHPFDLRSLLRCLSCALFVLFFRSSDDESNIDRSASSLVARKYMRALRFITGMQPRDLETSEPLNRTDALEPSGNQPIVGVSPEKFGVTLAFFSPKFVP